MLKTKAFSQYTEKKLEEQLNAFIRNIPRKALIDVKFSTSGTNDSNSGELFNALVIYED